MRSIASTSPVGLRVNLYAPWLVPMATASASTPVSATNRSASSGSVSSWSCDEHAFGAVAVFLFAVAVLERAEAAEFAFDRDALGVGQLRRLPSSRATL